MNNTNKNSISFWLISLMQDAIIGLVDALKRLNFLKKHTPTLLSYNIVWFTNCSWLEQLVAFKQISMYYYQDKGNN